MTARGKHEERFAREAQVLAELNHPAIVRYVAHGETAQGQPYLVMEWLEGEDLSQRLTRLRLSVRESLDVARRVAEALAAAHARGVVHRDVKPSNVLLVEGLPARAKLIDFGIVRRELTGMAPTAQPMTRTGAVMGTVGYMSPEQAIGDKNLDARADVFALGCLLFQCLTGEPVFSGDHVVAVLAKGLREEAPRVRALRPELPAALDALVARMLSKDRAARPEHGAAVLTELVALGNVVGGAPEAGLRPAAGLSVSEQRMTSVILAHVSDQATGVSEIVRRHGLDLARLANGALLVTLGARAAASGQVMIAAACALDLLEAHPSARIALATGRALTTAGGPPGPVIDKAASLLVHSASLGIRLDEVTAGLLGERFEIREQGRARILVGKRSEVESSRTLLGKATPFVGRDKELGLLDLTLRECIDESVARAVLVTGPPGQGKSRLRHEFVARVRERGDASVLVARADPVGAGSAFALVRQLVRQAVGLREGEPAIEQQTRLRAYVADVCPGVDCGRIADFLGELIGAPPAERPSPQLRAGRNDPQIMGVWLRRSFGEWLAAACARGPLVLVLEDLHWGDLPSIMYLGEALRSPGTKSLMLLALARPEVHDAFPALWKGAELLEVALGRLPSRAAERLVRWAVGETLSAAAVSRIVERADGNAFYLEELIRHVAQGKGDALPETVLALVQSRLEQLEPDARRIVRAASIFGEVFWRGGVSALLGKAAAPSDLDAWLRILLEREVLAVGQESRFHGEAEYTFRHGLLRDAAHAMLTNTDAAAGHWLAGEWLEQAGERDALALADHFERGGEPARAVSWLLRAAQTAVDGGHVDAAVSLGERGIACGAAGTERGLLRLAQSQARAMEASWLESVAMVREAMALLPAGSPQWFCATAALVWSGSFLGAATTTAAALQAILNVPVEPQPSGPYGFATFCAAQGVAYAGRLDDARSLLERAERAESGSVDVDPVFVMWLRIASGYLQLLSGELGSALAHLSEGRALADRTGAAFGQAMAGVLTVSVLAQTGHVERAAAAARETLVFCEPMRLHMTADWTTLFLAGTKVVGERAADAIAALRSLLDRHDRRLVTCARALLSQALLICGNVDEAAVEATVATTEGALFPREQAVALASHALIELRLDRPLNALALARRGLDPTLPATYPVAYATLHLARAEALHALGQTPDAHAAIREARDRILRIAATLDELELRESYVTNVDANARTLKLAREWLGEEAATT